MTTATDIARQKQDTLNRADLARANTLLEAFFQAYRRDFEASRMTDRQDAAFRALLGFRVDQEKRVKPA